MILKKNSIHAFVYTSIYGFYYPPNLCAYFGKMVFAFIIFLPLFVLSLPALITTKYENRQLTRDDNWLQGLMIWFVLGVLFCMVSCWFYPLNSDVALASIGYALWIVLTALLFIWGVFEGVKWFINRTPKKQKEPGIIKEYLKAKKRKILSQDRLGITH